SSGSALAIQSDGKIIVAGIKGVMSNPSELVYIIRYNTIGVVDNTFGNGGSVLTTLTQDARIKTVAIQDDGKILIAGIMNYGSHPAKAILLRYNSNGSLDPNFGSGGVDSLSILNYEDVFNSIAVQPDGKIIAGGNSDFFINYIR